MVIDELDIGHVPISGEKICYISVLGVTCKAADVNGPQVRLLTTAASSSSSSPWGWRTAPTMVLSWGGPPTGSRRALALRVARRPPRAA